MHRRPCDPLSVDDRHQVPNLLHRSHQIGLEKRWNRLLVAIRSVQRCSEQHSLPEEAAGLSVDLIVLYICKDKKKEEERFTKAIKERPRARGKLVEDGSEVMLLQ